MSSPTLHNIFVLLIFPVLHIFAYLPILVEVPKIYVARVFPFVGSSRW